MSNIQFNYLFRDTDNYKIYGSEVFSNEKDLSISVIQERIRSKLIDGQYFYPSQWGLPLLYSEDGWGMEETDWCEYEGVEETDEDDTRCDVSLWIETIFH